MNQTAPWLMQVVRAIWQNKKLGLIRLWLGHALFVLWIIAIITSLPAPHIFIAMLFCYGRRAPKFIWDILRHKKIGPIVRTMLKKTRFMSWNEKVLALLINIATSAIPLSFTENIWIWISLGCCFVFTSIFILTRKPHPPISEPSRTGEKDESRS